MDDSAYYNNKIESGIGEGLVLANAPSVFKMEVALLTHVDCAGESAGLSQHCESVVKVSYVVLGLLFVKEHGLVASEHLSGVVLGYVVSGGATVDAVKQFVKNAGSGFANESCGEFPGLNKLLVHMRFCQGGPTPRQKRQLRERDHKESYVQFDSSSSSFF